MAALTMKELLEVGLHFGHQTKRWNPKMKKYIFGSRNGIYIVDLQQSLQKLREANDFLRSTAAAGGKVLFVGTKKQAQECIEAEAKRCSMFYVTQRWLGGTLTNFKTIQRSIERLRELEGMKEQGLFDALSKKEQARLDREMGKLEKYLGGIKGMEHLPEAVFIVDTKKEQIAVRETAKLGIPSVAIVDTNCNPDDIDFVIPGNDDAIRAIRLIASKMADAVLEGLSQREAMEEVGEEAGAGIAEMERAMVEAAEQAPDEGMNAATADEGTEKGGEGL